MSGGSADLNWTSASIRKLEWSSLNRTGLHQPRKWFQYCCFQVLRVVTCFLVLWELYQWARICQSAIQNPMQKSLWIQGKAGGTSPLKVPPSRSARSLWDGSVLYKQLSTWFDLMGSSAYSTPQLSYFHTRVEQAF